MTREKKINIYRERERERGERELGSARGWWGLLGYGKN